VTSTVVRRRSARWVDGLAFLCVIAYAMLTATLSIRQHDSFHTHAFDMGYIDNVVWNTSQGRLFVNDFADKPRNYLGDHFSPALVLLSPLYWLWSDPRALFIAQSIALALSILPCYWLVRRRYPRLALLVLVALLLNPALLGIALGEFHEIALAVPLLSWGLVALLDLHGHKQTIGIWVGLLGALLVKEEVAAIVATVGVYLILSRPFCKRYQSGKSNGEPGALTGLVLLVIAVGWLGFVWGALPAVLPDAVSHWQDRFGDIAPTPLQGAMRLLTDPAYTAGRYASAAKWQAVVRALWPLALLPLFAPSVFALSLPVIGYLLLSSKSSVSQLQFWYVTPLLPILFVATADAIARSPLRRAQLFTVALLAVSATAYVLQGPGPLAIQYEEARFDVNLRTTCGSRLLDLIPPAAPLSAQDNLIPHLAHRRTLFVFPSMGDPPAEYVALDSRYEFAGGYSNWPTVRPLEVTAVVNRFLSDPAYDLIGDACDYKVLQRTATPQIAHRLDVIFGGEVRLVGYAIAVADRQDIFQPVGSMPLGGQRARVILWWQPTARIAGDYTVFVHALDSGGGISGQHDGPPANGFRPTSQWAGQEIVRDIHYFTPSASATQIEVGLYNGQTGQRLVDANGTDAVKLPVGE
jgi:uncharacterized membrane protein